MEKSEEKVDEEKKLIKVKKTVYKEKKKWIKVKKKVDHEKKVEESW